MKTMISMAALCLSSALAYGKALPVAPDTCSDDISLVSYCTTLEAGTFSGPIQLKFFLVVPKEEYTNHNQIAGRYLDFFSWPSYGENAGADNINFRRSDEMAPIEDEEGRTIYRHYGDYQIKAPVVQWFDVRYVTHNREVEAYEGAEYSIEFEVQSEGEQEVPEGVEPLVGSVGIINQTGSFHVQDCSKSELCGDGEYLVMYETTVAPEIEILPKVAGGAIQRVIENIMIGMYLI